MTTFATHPDARTTGGFAPLRESGRRLWRALEAGRDAAEAGVSTLDVCRAVAAAIERDGGEAALLGERNAAGDAFGFAASVCVNEEAACAQPNARRLRAGDLLTIDAAARYTECDPRLVDASVALVVSGAEAPEREAMVGAAAEAVELAAAQMRPGVRWLEVAASVLAFCAERGYGVASGLAGHGVGVALHEGPTLAMFVDEVPASDFVIREGMTLCVEPVLTLPASAVGSAEQAQGGYPSLFPRRTPTRTLPDGWGVVTADRSPACCQERTIGVGPDGGVILTAA